METSYYAAVAELKHCPFCGGGDVVGKWASGKGYIESQRREAWGFFVACLHAHCKAMGPKASSLNEAFQQWNARHA